MLPLWSIFPPVTWQEGRANAEWRGQRVSGWCWGLRITISQVGHKYYPFKYLLFTRYKGETKLWWTTLCLSHPNVTPSYQSRGFLPEDDLFPSPGESMGGDHLDQAPALPKWQLKALWNLPPPDTSSHHIQGVSMWPRKAAGAQHWGWSKVLRAACCSLQHDPGAPRSPPRAPWQSQQNHCCYWV